MLKMIGGEVTEAELRSWVKQFAKAAGVRVEDVEVQREPFVQFNIPLSAYPELKKRT